MLSIIENKHKIHHDRFKAFFIDWVIIITSNIFISILLETYFTKIDFIEIRIGLTYFMYFTFSSAKYGYTIGKKLLNFKVINLKENNSISILTSVYRHLPLLLIFIIGTFISSKIDEEPSISSNKVYKSIIGLWFAAEIIFYLIMNNGQMLHDYIAKTKVIKTS